MIKFLKKKKINKKSALTENRFFKIFEFLVIIPFSASFVLQLILFLPEIFTNDLIGGNLHGIITFILVILTWLFYFIYARKLSSFRKMFLRILIFEASLSTFFVLLELL